MTAHGSDDDLRACLRTLQAIDADRGLLARLSEAERRDLLMVAARITRPDRGALRQMAKAFRRSERAAARRQDQAALEQAGLRIQRRSETYAPLWLTPPADAAMAGADAGAPVLNSARTCYVCKQPFTDVHRYYDSMCRDLW